MKKPNFCLTVFSILVISFFSACSNGSPTGPDGPDDNEVVEHYDYTVTYIRPPGSIVRPEMSDPIMFTTQDKNGNRPNLNLTKVTDYEFTGTIVGVPTHLKKDKALPPNYICVVDAKRWVDMWTDGTLWWGVPHSVGDIFKLKNNTTGAELILNNIVVPNPMAPSWSAQCEAKAAQFWTIKGGAIKNSWPY